MINDRTRRTALQLLSAVFLVVLVSGTNVAASTLGVEAEAATMDSEGRLVLLAGQPVVLRVAGAASEERRYRWSCRRADDETPCLGDEAVLGRAAFGEGRELRPEFGIGAYEITLEADGAAESASVGLVVRRTPLVVVGGWAGGLDREALAKLETDYLTGYRDAVLDPLAEDTLTANAWLDFFGRRPLRSAFAPILAEVLAETSYRTGVGHLDVVAHGVGGLAVRWLVRHGSSAGIRRVVYLGTPTHGTDLGTPTMRAFEFRAGLVGGRRIRDALKGLGPDNGAELLEMTERLEGRLPFYEGVAPERIAAALAAIQAPELTPHSSFLKALNGHRGMLPVRGERPAWAPAELALAGSWGSTTTHSHASLPGVEASFAVPRLVKGDRVVAAAGVGWGAGAPEQEALSYLDLSVGYGSLLPLIRDFLLAGRRLPSPPAQAATAEPPDRRPPERAAQIFFAESFGFYPPYPHKYDFGVETTARALVLTFFSSGNLSLDVSFRTRRGMQRVWRNSPGLKSTADTSMVELLVDRPRTGNWVAEVRGEKGAPYAVSATYDTPTYVAVGLSGYSVVPGEPVTVYGYAVGSGEDVPVELTAKAWLGEESHDVRLYDDGFHDDGERGDGLFAATFDAIEEPGTYLVVLEGFFVENRQRFSRWSYERFTVEALPDLEVTGGMLLCESAPRSSEPFGVAVVVQNRGDADARAAVVELFAGHPRRGGALVGRDVVDVVEGGSAVARFSLEAPAGEHRLHARVSAFNAFLEKDYTNNAASLPVHVTGPELGSASAGAPGAGPRLEILSPPPGARIAERALVTVRAGSPGLTAVEVSLDGRPAGSCEAGGRTRIDCHVAIDASARGKKLRVTAVARDSAGESVRQEASYTVDRKAPKLRVGEGVVDRQGRLRLSYRLHDRGGVGEVLAFAGAARARAGAGEVTIDAASGTEVVLYAADRACNLARATFVVPPPAPEVFDGDFETGGLGRWDAVTGKRD